jgi:hypothetical protein
MDSKHNFAATIGNDGLRRLQQFNPSNKVLSSLPEAAAFFVEMMLGVPPTSTQYQNPGHLLNLSYDNDFGDIPEHNLVAEFHRHVAENLPEDYRASSGDKFQAAITFMVTSATSGTPTPAVGNICPSPRPPTAASMPQNQDAAPGSALQDSGEITHVPSNSSPALVPSQLNTLSPL